MFARIRTALLLAALIPASAARATTFVPFDGGGERIPVGDGATRIDVWGQNLTSTDFHDFTLVLHGTDDPNVNIYRVKVYPGVETGPDGEPSRLDGRHDWDIDDDHGQAPPRDGEAPHESAEERDNRMRQESDNVDDTPGKTTRVIAGGAGVSCCGSQPDRESRETKGADGQTKEDTNETDAPDVSDRGIIKGKKTDRATGKETVRKFKIEVTLTAPAPAGVTLEVIPSDEHHNAVAFLDGGLKTGENHVQVPSAHPYPHASIAARNATGRTIAGLTLESEGDFLLSGLRELDADTFAPRNQGGCLIYPGSSCELVFARPVPAGGIVAFDMAFDHMDSSTSSTNLIVRPILDAYFAPLADLAIAAEHSSDEAADGIRAGIVYTVTNHGPAATANVALASRLEGTHEVLSASSSRGTPFIGRTAAGGLITCELGSLAAGEEARVTIVLQRGEGELHMDSWTTGGEVDPNWGDNRVRELVPLASPGAASDVFIYGATVFTDGFFFGLGPCGQAAGSIQVDGIGLPALRVGAETRTLPGLGRLAQGMAVNGDGWLAGQYITEQGFQAFVIPRGGPAVPLPTLGGNLGSAQGIDGTSRWVVGASSADTSPLSPWRATVWTIDSEGGEVWGVPRALPTLGGAGGIATRVNDRGEIAGWTADAGEEPHAALWLPIEAGQYRVYDLGKGFASGINRRRTVVGSLKDAGGVDRAFALVRGETMPLRGPADCPECESHAVDVNDAGRAVGWVRTLDGSARAVAWDIESPASDAVYLDDLLALRHRGELHLEVAFAVNEASQVVAMAVAGGQPRSLVLTPEGAAGVDVNRNAIPDSCEAGYAPFTRGDANGEGRVDLSDAVSILGGLFLGAETRCADAADSNDDGRVDISDAVYVLGFLYLGGESIPAPAGSCGSDPTPDSLGCADSSVCGLGSEPHIVATPCAGGRLLVRYTRWECRGGLWTLVTYADYACPDGSIDTVVEDLQRTELKCP